MLPRIVYCAWLGRDPMSANRTAALASIVLNVGCPVLLFNDRTVRSYELPDAPFHPAFDYLSVMHKVDYLRVYLMHHYGGGYTDIKHISVNWSGFFDALEASDAYALGYPEVSVANVGHPLEEELHRNIDRLIGVCAFIFKSRTIFTQEWLDGVHDFLDGSLMILKRSTVYPLEWDAVMGNLLHPLMYRESTDNILRRSEIMPRFDNYR